MDQFPRFVSSILCIQTEVPALRRDGFPIRESRDQRMFAPPPGLSQLTTPFIDSSAKASTVRSYYLDRIT